MLNLDGADRRRVVVASIVTLVALPSLWLMNRDDPAGPATVSPANVVLGHDSAATEPARERAMGSAGGAFLNMPEEPLERPREPGDPITVAVPAAPRGSVATGRATFRSSIPSESACLVRGAPHSARVTVTNVDNGRSVTCVASVSPVGSRDDIVLHTSSFTRIADLTDAPVPVEISW